MNLEGFRTIIAAVIGGPLTIALAKYGLNLTPDQQTAVVGIAMTVLMCGMRFVTKSPVFGSKEAAPAPVTPPKQGGHVLVGMLLALVAAGVICVLSACSVLGISKPLSLDEQLAAAQVTRDAVESAATTAFQSHTLSESDFRQVVQMAKTTREFISAAKLAEDAGNVAGANQELQLATSALTALQTYINAHAAKGAK
jgi:hypothetical protein